MPDILQTEFKFELPMGYVDDSGTLHKRGTIRLATAADEIQPLKDPRVKENPAFLSIILLTRVVTGLGQLKMINTNVIGSLFAGDFEYLQDLYNRINKNGTTDIATSCPKCEHKFAVEGGGLGEP